jgi:hypothetical protein
VERDTVPQPFTKPVRIYRPARTAMQQGRAKTKHWVIEQEQPEPKSHDPLMGWISSGDTRAQVKLRFETKEEAIAYCQRHGLVYRVEEPKEAVIRPKSYAANFAWNRVRT